MRVLVIGSKGQLATKLGALDGVDDTQITVAGRPQVDICDPGTITSAISRTSPDIVVNAAAYTAVDKAEDDQEAAFAVNRDGAGAVAKAATVAGLPIIHVSTDYVFKGDKPEPYVEEDETGPTGVYGLSKLEGERAVAAANPRHLIFRTAWVYSDIGDNFVKTMLRLAAHRDELDVVADQFGNPTSAADLASGILHAARRVYPDPRFEEYGVYHLTGSGETNWAGFAREIFAVSSQQGGPSAKVNDITTEQYPTPAKRPANSRLSNKKIERVFGLVMPDWRQSCETVVTNLMQD